MCILNVPESYFLVIATHFAQWRQIGESFTSSGIMATHSSLPSLTLKHESGPNGRGLWPDPWVGLRRIVVKILLEFLVSLLLFFCF